MNETRYLVDGRSACVDPADRGLAYGDGLFETMAARDGELRWLGHHKARLAEGCRRLGIPEPDWEIVRAEIARLAPSSGRAVVKLIVTRGSGARGYRPPEKLAPCRILSIGPWPVTPASHYTHGIVVHSCRIRLGENPALAGMKHLCRLEQVLAQRELADTGADEGLVLGASGFVAGGTSSNAFAVSGTRLLTPAITRCGVKGVMRQVVLEAAAKVGLEAVETDMDLGAIRSAGELFLTSTLRAIRPVRELDGRAFAVGPHTRALMQRVGELS
jgi:4-amino-4-deoxychorismate lyase